MNDKSILLKTLFLFLLAGIFEIGGGYLVWLWVREDSGLFIGILGGLALILYGILQTFQLSKFGRVYAAYGGIFIFMSLFWGWAIDGVMPDRFDFTGATIAIFGALIIYFWPRGEDKTFKT